MAAAERLGSHLHGQWFADQLSECLSDSDSWRPDLKLVCGGGENQSVKLHRCVLASQSSFLSDVFLDNDDDDELVMILPDTCLEEAQVLRQLLYTGQTDHSYSVSSHIIDALQGLAKRLKLRPISVSVQDMKVSSEPELMVKDLSSSDDEEEEEEKELFFDSLMTVHTKRIKNVEMKCSIDGCQETFVSSAKLKRHAEHVHGDSSAFGCEECGNRYKSQSAYRDHLLRNHRDEKPHLCDVCGKSFRTKDQCSSHRLLHGERRLKCQECGATFKQRNVLYQHVMIQHRAKRFTCAYCGKAFAKKQNRDTHQRTHTGEAPFACQVCDSRFKRHHHLKKHLKSLVHIDKVAEMRQKKLHVPEHLDPQRVLGQEEAEAATAAAQHSKCDVCSNNATGPQFKSAYHFHKHIRSRSHLQKILQKNQLGHRIPQHLIPPDLINTEVVTTTTITDEDDNIEEIFILPDAVVEQLTQSVPTAVE